MSRVSLLRVSPDESLSSFVVAPPLSLGLRFIDQALLLLTKVIWERGRRTAEARSVNIVAPPQQASLACRKQPIWVTPWLRQTPEHDATKVPLPRGKPIPPTPFPISEGKKPHSQRWPFSVLIFASQGRYWLRLYPGKS